MLSRQAIAIRRRLLHGILFWVVGMMSGFWLGRAHVSCPTVLAIQAIYFRELFGRLCLASGALVLLRGHPTCIAASRENHGTRQTKIGL